MEDGMAVAINVTAISEAPRLRTAASAADTYQTIKVTPLSPHIGAEIGNLDITRPLSDQEVADLKAAFTRHLVIFFRDQPISHDDQVRLAGYFGQLGRHVGASTLSKKTDNPYINQFDYDENSKRISGEVWHTDQSCAPIPPLGSMLYNHIVPPDGGGDTMFANMYRAYDALSDSMKVYLQGKTATHDGVKIFGAGTPTASHPVITRHPESGKKLIYVNAAFTTKIDGLPKRESARILDFLFEHVAQPEWTTRFRWRAHSIAFWDNRCAQHYAINDYWPNVRSGFRVQIEGTAAPVAG
jgi:taurine dioxygenase